MKNNKFKIYPSILTADLGQLEKQITTAEENGVDGFHIDIMDGQFVPPITFGPIIVSHIRKITELPIDIHMMVINPDRFFEELLLAGADSITIHYESTSDFDKTIEKLLELKVESSIAINPDTQLVDVQNYLTKINQILIMSVNPGYGGQKFIPSSIQKIESAKSLINDLNLKTKIQVDGGINSNTIDSVLVAGADIVVAGSAVYNDNSDIKTSIQTLKDSISL
ncbi:MAG: ribulose-phosphate 3-epimerase [Dehalococcoidia bacterium]